MRRSDLERPAHGRTVVDATGSEQGNLNDGLITGLLAYFDRHGIWTHWYWPPGVRGRAHNFFHGHGWRIS